MRKFLEVYWEEDVKVTKLRKLGNRFGEVCGEWLQTACGGGIKAKLHHAFGRRKRDPSKKISSPIAAKQIERFQMRKNGEIRSKVKRIRVTGGVKTYGVALEYLVGEVETRHEVISADSLNIREYSFHKWKHGRSENREAKVLHGGEIESRHLGEGEVPRQLLVDESGVRCRQTSERRGGRGIPSRSKHNIRDIIDTVSDDGMEAEPGKVKGQEG